MKPLLTIPLLLLCLCGCSDHVQEFEECYPKDKLQVLNESLSKLDSALQARYPNGNVWDSYFQYSKDILHDISTPSEVLSNAEIKEIRKEFDRYNIYEDFEIINEYGYEQNNLSGDLWPCIKSLEGNKHLNLYIDGVEDQGYHYSFTQLLAIFADEKTKSTALIIKYIVKLDLLFHFVKYQDIPEK